MAQTMRSLLAAATRPLVVPSVYDGISARAAREVGFEAGFVGSHAIAASRLGITDTGFVSLEDMADATRRVAAVFDVPLLVDGEGGWGNPIHVAHSVRVLERAGASMIQIEDELFGKHVAPQSILPIDQAVDKIKAAVDARVSGDTMILARTDAASVEGLEGAFERVLKYRDAGADAFVIPLPDIDPERLATVRRESGIPLVAVNRIGHSATAAAGDVMDMIVYYGATQRAAATAVLETFRAIADKRTTVGLEENWMSMTQLDDLLGLRHVRQEAVDYGLIPADAEDFFARLTAVGAAPTEKSRS